MQKNYRECNIKSCNCNQDGNQVIENVCDDVMTFSDYELDNCNCGFIEDTPFPENPMYGNSYVPNQVLDSTFLPDVGLKLGTIFPQLVRPYIPGESMDVIEYLRKSGNSKGECNCE